VLLLTIVAGVAAVGVGPLVRHERGGAVDLHGVGYVGSAACRKCHADQHASWHRTFHRTMTTEATPKNVRGDFSGVTLTHAGVTAQMDRDEAGGFRMTFARPGEPPRVAKVVRAVGSRRYQQYLAADGDSLWRLPVAYHLEEKRWFPMTGAFLFADPSADDADDPTHPRYGGGAFDRHVTRWNDNCVFCHNVGPNPGRDATTGAFKTEVAELGIACEACHGPGGEHVRRNDSSLRRLLLGWGDHRDPTIVNPRRLPPARAAELCGRCHGQRITDDVGPFLAHGDPFVAGDELARYSRPLSRDTPLHGDSKAFAARFWADGTPRLTAYEYQGLLMSPCARRGPLTCTSCHGMHEGDPRGQLRAAFAGPGAASDRMCTQCHQALAAPEALGAHAHHDPAGEGARCVGCHMPRIVYGVLDAHRSHRIEVPTPAEDASAGRPDACTNCHVTRSSYWAEAEVRLWSRAPQVGGIQLSPATQVLGGDPVARAMAADALGRAPFFPSASAPSAGEDDRAARFGLLLEVMKSDRFPAVRHIAWRSLRRLVKAAAVAAVDYDPSADAATRERAVERLHTALGWVVEPARGAVSWYHQGYRDAEVQIGE
jgi:hypothetical protein